RHAALLRSLAGNAKLGVMTTSAQEIRRVPEIKIHHRFRIAREAAGLEQGQLAKAIGVSRTSISNAELGKHSPRKIMINAWAMATGVPVEWLETGKAPRPDGPGEGQDGALPHLDSNQKPADSQFAPRRPAKIV